MRGSDDRPGWETSELDVQINQGDAVGSGFTVPSVPCDNAWRPVRFVISDISGSFVPATVSISSQVLVTNDASGDSAGGHDVGRIGCIRRPHTTHASCPTG